MRTCQRRADQLDQLIQVNTGFHSTTLRPRGSPGNAKPDNIQCKSRWLESDFGFRISEFGFAGLRVED